MEQKTYYSEVGLTMWPGEDGGVTTVMNNGTVQQITRPAIKFSRMGASQFFSFNTENPKEIEWLDARMEKVRDVFGPEEFNRRITPDSQKISALESKLRELEQKNSLLEKLQAQGKLPTK